MQAYKKRMKKNLKEEKQFLKINISKEINNNNSSSSNNFNNNKKIKRNKNNYFPLDHLLFLKSK